MSVVSSLVNTITTPLTLLDLTAQPTETFWRCDVSSSFPPSIILCWLDAFSPSNVIGRTNRRGPRLTTHHRETRIDISLPPPVADYPPKCDSSPLPEHDLCNSRPSALHTHPAHSRVAISQTTVPISTPQFSYTASPPALLTTAVRVTLELRWDREGEMVDVLAVIDAVAIQFWSNIGPRKSFFQMIIPGGIRAFSAGEGTARRKSTEVCLQIFDAGCLDKQRQIMMSWA
ncbi:hypothetical protein C8R44DRAFT_981405 [Mycena epipterygia]|nr:hypothetical protein C8R44DRAFT_981405 [Mycena epipterygia]